MSHFDHHDELDLLDETPVAITMPLGALAALCMSHMGDIVCAGKCGDPSCEVYGYAVIIARRALGTAFGEATGLMDDHILDVRAANEAGLDQWRASMKERGLA